MIDLRKENLSIEKFSEKALKFFILRSLINGSHAGHYIKVGKIK
jgi:hypothetical protein